MYKRNELYRKIADGVITPEQLVDIILRLQEDVEKLKKEKPTKTIKRFILKTETKRITNPTIPCQIAIMHQGEIINSVTIPLKSLPSKDDKIIINTKEGSIPFKVKEVLKDITMKKGKLEVVDIVYVENY